MARLTVLAVLTAPALLVPRQPALAQVAVTDSAPRVTVGAFVDTYVA